MLRNEWKFRYTASQLANAAKEKRDHHQSRLEWWNNKQKEVVAQIKENGLEVSEASTLASEYSIAASSAHWFGNAQLVVNTDYQKKLNECHQKIQSHKNKAAEFDGWLQMLESNPDAIVPLDSEDFLFFFGK